MRKLAATAAIVLALGLAGCGSSGDDATTTTNAATPETTATTLADTTTTEAETTTTTEGTAPAGDGELPSYEDVKALYLETVNDVDRASCDEGPTEDKKVGAGGDYVRFMCKSLARFDYVSSADAYADNFEAATDDLMGRAVFHIPGVAYVKPAGANDTLAPAIQEACGCGEVLGPES